MLAFSRLRPSILDRYIIAETIPPTAIGLLVFSFILLIDQVPRLLAVLVARSADAWIIARVFANLVPSILAVTIPMAFLLGVLLAFGRLASESELIAMRANGVSVGRLAVPVIILSALTGGVTFYIHAVALPAGNQAFRELVFGMVAEKARTVVRARNFTAELDPSDRMMLFVSDIAAESGMWKDVFIYDSREMDEPRLLLAREGRVRVDEDVALVSIELSEGVRHVFSRGAPREYRQERFRTLAFPLSYDEFFPKRTISKSDREMTLRDLSAELRTRRAAGKPATDYNRFLVEWHKKFSIPFACPVFGLLALGLSLGSRKEARSAAFALSIAVIFVYYVLIRLGEQMGDTALVAPWAAMWAPNVVLGLVGAALLLLNHREAAFDPLDPRHYVRWLPNLRIGGARRPSVSRRDVHPRPVVVLRVPRIGVGFPSILDRYVARAWMGNFALVLVAFVAIFVLASFMDLVDDAQHNKVRWLVFVDYYTYFLPQIAYLMAPVAVLVSVLVTYGLLARRNEITAMKAGGISLYRAAGPVIALGALTSFGIYVGADFILPVTNRMAARHFNVIKGRPPEAQGKENRRWILGSDGRIYNFDYLEVRDTPVEGSETSRREVILNGLSVYDVEPQSWDLRERFYAGRATWNGERSTWDIENGWRLNLTPAPRLSTFAAARVRPVSAREPGGEIEPPTYFAREEKPAERMTFGELKTHIARVRGMGFDATTLEVQLHRKLAFPMVGLVMTLLGIPFSFIVSRRGALYGVGIAIVIAIVYWTFLATFEALGNNAVLPPVLAAWAPNLLFGATGLYLVLTIDT